MMIGGYEISSWDSDRFARYKNTKIGNSKKIKKTIMKLFFTTVGRDPGDGMQDDEGSFEPIGRGREGSKRG